MAVLLEKAEEGPHEAWVALSDLGFSLGPPDYVNWCETFLAYVGSRHSGESPEIWRSLVLPPPSARPGPGASRSASNIVWRISSDRGIDANDALEQREDVDAFARLLCHKDTSTPVSIAVFGGWGSGKTTFMEALQASIKELTSRASSDPPTDPIPKTMIRNVVQIRFNAWHFQDANLWASLTSVFFDQLRAGGFERQGAETHRRLVESVNSHVHKLSEAAGATNDALRRSEEALVKAQRERDVALRTVASQNDVKQTLVDAVSSAYEASKDDLQRLTLTSGGKPVANQIDELVTLAQSLHVSGGRFAAFVRFLFRAERGKTVFWLLFAIAACIAAIAISIAWGGPLGSVLAYLASGGAIAATGTIVAVAARVIRFIGRIADRTSKFVEGMEAAPAEAVKQLAVKETSLRSAEKEATANREAADRASHALSRYFDSKEDTNPPRLLRYVLEDNPETKALEKEIGLVSRAHRLFYAVNQIANSELAEHAIAEAGAEAARKEGQLAGDAPPAPRTHSDTPERFIIYIDDLDRCSYEQVYAVLQAVHLLLAFDLFVVVVAVDAAWVQDALASQMGNTSGSKDGRANGPDDSARTALATRYLEKIFQIPFWLRPLSADGRHGTYGRFIESLLGEAAAPPLDKAPAPSGPGAATPSGPRQPLPSLKTDQPNRPSGAAEKPAEKAESILTPIEALQLTSDEREFLARPEIGKLASPTPRGVKRLVNTYRLARARLIGGSLAEEQRLAPLIALATSIETGQPASVANSLQEQVREMLDKPRSPDTLSLPLAASFSNLTNAIAELVKSGQAHLETADRLAIAAQAAELAAFQASGAYPSLEDYSRVASVVRRYSFNRL